MQGKYAEGRRRPMPWVWTSGVYLSRFSLIPVAAVATPLTRAAAAAAVVLVVVSGCGEVVVLVVAAK